VFQDINELNLNELPKEITLYSQTTKSVNKFHELSNTLKEAGIGVNANDTICRQVSNRDEELRNFAKRYDTIIFVSGTKSSNGKVLYQACLNQNSNTHFVSSVDQLDNSWFLESKTVGICGATSTPLWLMEDIKYRISTY
jgi:4-hydroxy-3-methylbut-2-enyl diphosphate reductase